MQNIKINSGIKKIGIENEDGEVVAVLKIDISNNNIINKFANMVNRANEIQENFNSKIEEKERLLGNITSENVSEIMDIYKKSAKELVDETTILFGTEIFKDIFADNYEIDPDFIPDVSVITDVFAQLMPILKELFANQKSDRYSPAKKGKKTRTQEIEEFKASQHE